MVRISIEKDERQRRVVVSAEGHAGCAPKGSDIVCAAVSALLFGYAKEVAMMGDRGRLRHAGEINLGGEDGRAHIDVVATDAKAYRRILYHLAPAERALEKLAEDCPEAVRLERE